MIPDILCGFGLKDYLIILDKRMRSQFNIQCQSKIRSRSLLNFNPFQLFRYIILAIYLYSVHSKKKYMYLKRQSKLFKLVRRQRQRVFDSSGIRLRCLVLVQRVPEDIKPENVLLGSGDRSDIYSVSVAYHCCQLAGRQIYDSNSVGHAFCSSLTAIIFSWSRVQL